MSRLIDADKLTYHLAVNDEDEQFFYVKSEDIDDAPSIDPVRAAGGCYCGECKYWTGGFDGRCLMHSRGEDVIWFSYASDFCRRGKRREENEV